MQRMTFFAGGTSGSAAPAARQSTSILTTSFGVVVDDIGYIIDHGYGIQKVVPWLKEQKVAKVVILQTHFHTDHVAGLPLNGFLFQREIPVLGIWSQDRDHMERTWAHFFDKLHWPVSPGGFGFDAPAMASLKGMQIGVVAHALNHAGGSTAFRILHGSKGDIVIATDHEASDPAHDQAYADFVDGAKLLVVDIQYRQREYDGLAAIGEGKPMSRKGFGHSTPEQMLRVLGLCKRPPEIIRVTHHDPMRAEHDLFGFEAEIQRALEEICSDVAILEDDDLIKLN